MMICRRLLLVPLIVPLWMLALDIAGAGERQLCQMEPGQEGEWHYRTRVEGKEPKCFYQGPRMKPRDELYWAEAPAVPSLQPVRPSPWSQELRWRGETE